MSVINQNIFHALPVTAEVS